MKCSANKKKDLLNLKIAKLSWAELGWWEGVRMGFKVEGIELNMGHCYKL